MCGASVQEKLLAERVGMMYNGKAVYPGIAQLVARVVWEHGQRHPGAETPNRERLAALSTAGLGELAGAGKIRP